MAISAQATGSASAAKKPVFQQSKPLPVPNSDFYQLADVLTPEEKAIVKKVRTYMDQGPTGHQQVLVGRCVSV
jgi:hypothetical protein